MPSDTVINPREHYNAITTWSGKVIEPHDKPTKVDKKAPMEEKTKEEETKEENTRKEKAPNYDDVTYIGGAINRNKRTAKKLSSGFSQPDLYAKAPYPLRQKQDKEKQQYSKFMEMFKKLQINISFSEALENMSLYAKFMKGLLSNRHKLIKMETLALTEERKALCDLGASVNLMPLSFEQSLGITERKSTMMSLQFVDRSIKMLEGVLEDVHVKVNDYIFPANFVVLNMEEDDNMPLILGLPFLATARTLIDVEQGQTIFRVNGGEFKMNVFEAMKHLEDKEDCFHIDEIEEAVSQKILEEANPPTIEHQFALLRATE
ncbi:uncharacterized protein LOC133312239 [Gastrolobium bilobum]|uniref:uncharacterized protein LOC133312239 n=1 Tax=Gastrolobium bilobum TaxID=150636 RepID=UPI002AAFE008|nr:uncharacterized protein LOC133312239 [Gastrolobium bilobum]